MSDSIFVYSLPFKCPIPWPQAPSYPIKQQPHPQPVAGPEAEPDLDLPTSYSNALYATPSQLQHALDSFARLALSHFQDAESTTAQSLATTFRSLVLPVHDFDLKYRSTVPQTISHLTNNNRQASTISHQLPNVPGVEEERATLSESDTTALLQAHQRWYQGLKATDVGDGTDITAQKERLDSREPGDLMDGVQALADVNGAHEMADGAFGEHSESGRPEGTLEMPGCAQGLGSNGEQELGVVTARVSTDMLIDGAENVGPTELEKPASWTVSQDSLDSWISSLELTETLLQCLLALLLLSLPPSDIPRPKLKKKHKSDPQRHAATLDPEVQLDYLTDRLELWRVHREVTSLDSSSSKTGTTGGSHVEDIAVKVLQRDEVHEWWEESVEPLFSPRLPSSILLPHRKKLFPASSTTESLSTRLEPAPSPFRVKDRTLLSLDRSARKKNSDNRIVSESPTMKRLLHFRNEEQIAASTTRNEMMDEGHVFKVPPPPPRRRKALSESTAASTRLVAEKVDHPVGTFGDAVEPPPSTKSRSRKQERPRPLIQTDSRVAAPSSKSLFNRRQVNLARRPHQPQNKKPPLAGASQPELGKSNSQPVLGGRGTKRKSASPIKTRPSEAMIVYPTTSSAPSFLIPDTPHKSPHVHSLPRSSFSRTQSLPSFAALGAAFRPGADPFQSAPLTRPAGREGSSFSTLIPPPPVLPGERDERPIGMEWESEGWEQPTATRAGMYAVGTPVKERTTGWVVPNT
ncbi:hypothetical protein P7C70_g452, partial [Phenoliferia sp. Uapishka_3]